VTAQLLSKLVRLGGQDTRIFGFPGDTYFEGLEKHVAAAGAFQRALASLPSDSVILDIGANIGVTAAMAARLSNAGAIYCVEPSPRAFACLKAMADANGFHHVSCIQSAMGSSPGTMFLAEYDTMAFSHASDSGTEVPVQTLDDLVAQLALERIDLIKLDVEGSELEVLKGGHSAIRRFDPTVFMEFNSFTLSVFGDISPKALLDFVLAEFGVIHAGRNGQPILVDGRGAIQHLVLTNMRTEACVEDVTFGGSLPHEAIHTDPRPAPAPAKADGRRGGLHALARRALGPFRAGR
jgi:FkbM family methyltransferase